MTVSRALRDKIERARDLMSHSNPKGDLTIVIDRAIDALLEKLEKQRLGAISRPEPSPRPLAKTSDKVPRATRRRVFKRDGEQCTYTDAAGRRCPSRKFLQLDHIISRAQGGTDDDDNLRVRCRPHNALHAEDVFGKDFVRECIRSRQRKSSKRAGANGKRSSP